MLFLMVAGVLAGVGSVRAETAFIYDESGDVAGTIMSANPNNSFIYGRDGELVGSTARAGNTVFIYDENGGLAGQVMSSGRRRND